MHVKRYEAFELYIKHVTVLSMLVLKLTFMLKVFLWTWAEDREQKVGSGGAQGI